MLRKQIPPLYAARKSGKHWPSGVTPRNPLVCSRLQATQKDKKILPYKIIKAGRQSPLCIEIACVQHRRRTATHGSKRRASSSSEDMCRVWWSFQPEESEPMTEPRYSPSQIGAFVLTKMPLGPDWTRGRWRVGVRVLSGRRPPRATWGGTLERLPRRF